MCDSSFKKLEHYGNTIIPAESGELASGLSGEGRMAEPEHIVSFLEADLESRLPLKGKKILITAGPTYEALDPVRFIGNQEIMFLCRKLCCLRHVSGPRMLGAIMACFFAIKSQVKQ